MPAAGEPGGGGVHAPRHHVRALLELLRWAACILSDVRLTIVLRDEIKETDQEAKHYSRSLGEEESASPGEGSGELAGGRRDVLRGDGAQVTPDQTCRRC